MSQNLEVQVTTPRRVRQALLAGAFELNIWIEALL